MVNISTLLTPTDDAFPRADPSSPKRPVDRGVPRINVNGVDCSPNIDQITSPVLTNGINQVYGNTNGNSSNNGNNNNDNEGNIDLDLPVVNKLGRAFTQLRRRRSTFVREPTITRDDFVVFLRTTQGEDDELIEQCLPKDKKRYFRHEFLKLWLMYFGWDAERPVRPADKDTNLPITNYFISSSHNTYLDGNQLASRSSPEAYRNVLSRGCRCIEIDVWNGDEEVPDEPSDSEAKRHRRNLSGTSIKTITENIKKTLGGDASLLGDVPDHARNGSVQSGSGPDPKGSTSGVSDRGSVHSSGNSAKEEDVEGDLQQPKPQSQSHSQTRQPYPRHEPIVTHGWTLTTPCGFREVCVAIRESAFETNDLPVIVSLEVHTNYDQQEVMVRIMKEEWGDLLLDEPLVGIDRRFRVPTLDDLRRKILIKVKKPPKRFGIPSGSSGTGNNPSANGSGSSGTLTSPPLPTFSQINEDVSAESDDDDDDDDSHSDNVSNAAATGLRSPSLLPPPQSPATTVSQQQQQPKQSRIPVGPVLGALAIYTHSERFKNFDRVSKKPSHIYSIAESRILELHASHGEDLFTHNKNYFMRLFPDGARFDSSNPDPSPFWRKGVQMVSLNWQYIDEALMLNEGMFSGENGWVLKPRGYLGSDKDCNSVADVKTAGTLMLSVAVLEGRDIWVPPEDDDGRAGKHLRPRVKVELHVEKPEGNAKETNYLPAAIGANRSFKLRTSSKRSENPNWGDKGKLLKFPLAHNVVEELSFVRFKIEDDSRIGRDQLLSWACIRVDRLRPGYRYVRLMDTKGRPIKDGKLLVRVGKVLKK